MKLELLEDLYAQQLNESLVAEKKTLQFMPRLLKAAQNEDLRFLIEQHARETEQQIAQLERISKKFSAPRAAKSGMVISALLEELESALSMEAEPDILEAALILGAQKIEHNEIACYAGMQTMAKLLTLEQGARTLGEILEQEKKMSEGLFSLAEALEPEAVEAENKE